MIYLTASGKRGIRSFPARVKSTSKSPRIWKLGGIWFPVSFTEPPGGGPGFAWYLSTMGFVREYGYACMLTLNQRNPPPNSGGDVDTACGDLNTPDWPQLGGRGGKFYNQNVRGTEASIIP
jgi:hypothetical protein